ncbi:MAG: hypothetical protein AB1451_12990 [Nitrospirota bacterium]
MSHLPIVLGVVGLFFATFALYFDGWWHIAIGRDTFWIPPHLVLYTAIGVTTLGFLARAWERRRAGVAWEIPLKIWGAGVTLIFLAAPFDELWHRLFGRESFDSLWILWSPPHVVAMASAIAIGIGLLMALARDGAPRGWWLALIVLTIASVGGFLNVLTIPFNPVDRGLGGPLGAFVFYLVFVSWRLAAVAWADRPVLAALAAIQWFFSSLLFLPRVIEGFLQLHQILLFVLAGVGSAVVGDAVFLALRRRLTTWVYPLAGAIYMLVTAAALYPLFTRFLHLPYGTVDLLLVGITLVVAGAASGLVAPRLARRLSGDARRPDPDRPREAIRLAGVMASVVMACVLGWVTLSDPRIVEGRGPRLIGTEESVARIPETMELENLRTRWAYVPPITTSPDGLRIAYKARRGAKSFLVIDGRPGQEYEVVQDLPRFSADGSHYMYPAWRDKKNVMVLDGVESEAFSHLGLTYYFTDDGQPVYVGVREIKSTAQPPADAGGKVPEYERDMDSVALNERIYRYGNTGGYYSTWVARPGRRLVVVRNGISSPEYDEIGVIDFSQDGQRLAYTARRGDRWMVVVDGVEQGDYDLALSFGGIIPLEIPGFFDPTGERVAYAAKRGGRWSAVIDGVEGPPYDWIDAFSARFSADGRHLAYKAMQAGQPIVVLDGAEQEARYDRIGSVAFLSDGRFVYLAERGHERFVVVDGHERPRPPGSPGWGLYFTLSPDGRRVAYVNPHAGGSKWQAIIDGMQPAAYDRILQPLFSPDSRHAAYLAARGVRWRAVIDGIEGELYDAIAGLHFEGPNRVTYLAVDGRSIVRVAHILSDDPHIAHGP